MSLLHDDGQIISGLHALSTKASMDHTGSYHASAVHFDASSYLSIGSLTGPQVQPNEYGVSLLG
jgi:hypothetical protein